MQNFRVFSFEKPFLVWCKMQKNGMKIYLEKFYWSMQVFVKIYCELGNFIVNCFIVLIIVLSIVLFIVLFIVLLWTGKFYWFNAGFCEDLLWIGKFYCELFYCFNYSFIYSFIYCFIYSFIVNWEVLLIQCRFLWRSIVNWELCIVWFVRCPTFSIWPLSHLKTKKKCNLEIQTN